jgi:hypothetical protein
MPIIVENCEPKRYRTRWWTLVLVLIAAFSLGLIISSLKDQVIVPIGDRHFWFGRYPPDGYSFSAVPGGFIVIVPLSTRGASYVVGLRSLSQ